MPVLVLMLVLMQMPTRCSAGGVWRSVPGQAADGGWRRMYMYMFLVLFGQWSCYLPKAWSGAGPVKRSPGGPVPFVRAGTYLALPRPR
ncbi:hypothetical protein V8C26DRAFT_389214 [Trichoderma gracile]